MQVIKDSNRTVIVIDNEGETRRLLRRLEVGTDYAGDLTAKFAAELTAALA